MINIELHFKGKGSKPQRLAALPRVGDYLTNSGKVWKVDSVLFNPGPQVYAVRVADILRDELETAWGAWGEPSTPIDGEGG